MKKVFIHFNYFKETSHALQTFKDDFVSLQIEGKLETDAEMEKVREDAKTMAKEKHPGCIILITGVTKTW